MWNARYSQPGFAYGTEPNEFLMTAAEQIPVGPVLTIGEGEGRNAAYLAGLGHKVVAVDQSEAGAVDGNGDGTFEIICGNGTGTEVRRFDGTGELVNEFNVVGVRGVRVAGSYKAIED